MKKIPLSSLIQMPPEILDSILRHLAMREMGRLRITCRFFHQYDWSRHASRMVAAYVPKHQGQHRGGFQEALICLSAVAQTYDNILEMWARQVQRALQLNDQRGRTMLESGMVQKIECCVRNNDIFLYYARIRFQKNEWCDQRDETLMSALIALLLFDRLESIQCRSRHYLQTIGVSIESILQSMLDWVACSSEFEAKPLQYEQRAISEVEQLLQTPSLSARFLPAQVV